MPQVVVCDEAIRGGRDTVAGNGVVVGARGGLADVTTKGNRSGQDLVVVEGRVGGMPRPPERVTSSADSDSKVVGGLVEHGSKEGGSSDAGGCSIVGGDSVDGGGLGCVGIAVECDGSTEVATPESLVGGDSIEEETRTGGLPRPPEGTGVHAGGGSPSPGGGGSVDNTVPSGGAEVVHSSAADDGGGKHDAVVGCKAEAGSRGLAGGKWVDAVDSDGHDALVDDDGGAVGCKGGGGRRSSRQQQVTAGRQAGKGGRGNGCNSSMAGVGRLPLNPKDEVFVDDEVIALIDGIWVETERLGTDYRSCWNKAVGQLTPLVSKRKKSSKGQECIRKWKRVLVNLRDF